MNSTTWEKFQGATLSLARAGALKDRITDAYRNHLSRIDEMELPRELREDFRAFSDAVTRERPLVRGDDAFRATIRKMSTDQAEEVATCVVRMFCALQQRGASLPPARPAVTAQIVPLYLTESLTAEA
jgi:hypothetical protein